MRATTIHECDSAANCDRESSSPASSRPWATAQILRTWRSLCCLAIFLEGLPVFFRLRLSGKRNWRAMWAQWISRKFLGLIDCSVRVFDERPSHGLIVCNHLGYLDILVILSACPAVFVSKDEVRRWPFFGLLATMAGTIFVERGRRTAVSLPLTAMTRALKTGLPVVIFPEGTSSDGSSVLPFRSSLLEAAIMAGVPITPAAISYDLEQGNVADEICYWGDMAFGKHFWNFLSKRSMRASVRFGTPRVPSPGRKEHAQALRLDVLELRRGQQSPLAPVKHLKIRLGAGRQR
jgi:1-acyl-sn-glycerol-3-phosphate acyltransferase